MEQATMEVRINGQVLRRPVSYIDRFEHKQIPETYAGEYCIWSIGSLVPTIIKVYEDTEI